MQASPTKRRRVVADEVGETKTKPTPIEKLPDVLIGALLAFADFDDNWTMVSRRFQAAAEAYPHSNEPFDFDVSDRKWQDLKYGTAGQLTRNQDQVTQIVHGHLERFSKRTTSMFVSQDFFTSPTTGRFPDLKRLTRLEIRGAASRDDGSFTRMLAFVGHVAATVRALKIKFSDQPRGQWAAWNFKTLWDIPFKTLSCLELDLDDDFIYEKDVKIMATLPDDHFIIRLERFSFQCDTSADRNQDILEVMWARFSCLTDLEIKTPLSEASDLVRSMSRLTAKLERLTLQHAENRHYYSEHAVNFDELSKHLAALSNLGFFSISRRGGVASTTPGAMPKLLTAVPKLETLECYLERSCKLEEFLSDTMDVGEQIVEITANIDLPRFEDMNLAPIRKWLQRHPRSCPTVLAYAVTRTYGNIVIAGEQDLETLERLSEICASKTGSGWQGNHSFYMDKDCKRHSIDGSRLLGIFSKIQGSRSVHITDPSGAILPDSFVIRPEHARVTDWILNGQSFLTRRTIDSWVEHVRATRAEHSLHVMTHCENVPCDLMGLLESLDLKNTVAPQTQTLPPTVPGSSPTTVAVATHAPTLYITITDAPRQWIAERFIALQDWVWTCPISVEIRCIDGSQSVVVSCVR